MATLRPNVFALGPYGRRRAPVAVARGSVEGSARARVTATRRPRRGGFR